MTKKLIVVGTESALKLRAVSAACAKLNLDAIIVGHEATSGVPKQPFGFKTMCVGARNRVNSAFGCYPGANYVIGIESGLVEINDAWFDSIAIAVGLTFSSHMSLWDSYSACLPIPKWVVDRIRVEDSELGVIMQELAEGGEKDAQWLSRGAFRREDQMEQAIIAAFAPHLNRDRYAKTK